MIGDNDKKVWTVNKNQPNEWSFDVPILLFKAKNLYFIYRIESEDDKSMKRSKHPPLLLTSDSFQLIIYPSIFPQKPTSRIFLRQHIFPWRKHRLSVWKAPRAA